MTIAVDTTFLTLLFNPSAKPPIDPATGKEVRHCALKVEALIDECSKRSEIIVIPAPCLAEVLMAVPDFQHAVTQINASPAFEIGALDGRCAIDLADFTRQQLANGEKKDQFASPHQRVKVDRQIAVIASVSRARCLYTDDDAQSKFANKLGLSVQHTWDLPLPASHAQAGMFDDE